MYCIMNCKRVEKIHKLLSTDLYKCNGMWASTLQVYTLIDFYCFVSCNKLWLNIPIAFVSFLSALSFCLFLSAIAHRSLGTKKLYGFYGFRRANRAIFLVFLHLFTYLRTWRWKEAHAVFTILISKHKSSSRNCQTSNIQPMFQEFPYRDQIRSTLI